ncbi:MAG: ATP-binding protein [Nitrospirota bacterium]|nr:ATP-binding protein [Nitrospirota bacterium]
MGFLTVMFGLMALRQVLTLLTDKVSWAVSVTGHTAELPGLIVSVMAFLAAFSLERIIVERKSAVEELLERREENTKLAVIANERGDLQDWINTLDTFVGKIDSNGIGIIFNNAPIKAGGLMSKDIVGKYFPDTKWWSHSRIERERIIECIEKAKNGLSSRIETTFISADGREVPIIFNSSPVMDTGGKIKYITAEAKTIIEEVKLRDALQKEKEHLEKRVEERTSELVTANDSLKKEITERKQAQAHIQHLQRVLMAIRDVNQLIVHEKNLKKLLQGICDILNQTRDYKLVWIGLVNEDNMEVTAVAQSGFEDGYLKSITITWDDSVTGIGPTGTAIKTRKPCVMHNIAENPRFKPWGEEAARRGYGSSAAFPLIYESRVFGALNVYANLSGAFDGEEIDLLVEVSQDIAFAIYIIEVEKDRARAEDALRKAHEELETRVSERTEELNTALTDMELARDRIDGIIKSIADGLIVTDIDNRVILINRAAEELLSVRADNVINRPIDFAIHEKTLREKVKYTLDKKTTGYQFDFELPGIAAEHPRIMRAITSVIQDKKGGQSGIVMIIHDVTSEREMDRMKTEFISTTAHEFRTPLTSIRGFSEILLTRDNISSTEKEKFLLYINKQAINLTRIITELLDISRIESGRGFSLNRTICNAGETVESVTSYYQSMSSRHIFSVDLHDKSTKLFIDREKIERVLTNILDNAINYSPDGGTILVTGEMTGNYYRISVNDQGIGMTPEQVDRIFVKFFRADTTASAPEGTGLGMTIVKYIVEAHGGKVWVESQMGKGTSVRFTIPIGTEKKQKQISRNDGQDHISRA